MYAPEVVDGHNRRILAAKRPPKPPSPPLRSTPPKAWKPPAPIPPPPSPAQPAGSAYRGGAPSACDEVCQAQTSLIQMSAVLLTFILMALSGTCCLSAVRLAPHSPSALAQPLLPSQHHSPPCVQLARTPLTGVCAFACRSPERAFYFVLAVTPCSCKGRTGSK